MSAGLMQLCSSQELNWGYNDQDDFTCLGPQLHWLKSWVLASLSLQQGGCPPQGSKGAKAEAVRPLHD